MFNFLITRKPTVIKKKTAQHKTPWIFLGFLVFFMNYDTNTWLALASCAAVRTTLLHVPLLDTRLMKEVSTFVILLVISTRFNTDRTDLFSVVILFLDP